MDGRGTTRPAPCRTDADEPARRAFLAAFEAFEAAPGRETAAACDLALLDATLAGQGRPGDVVAVLEARRGTFASGKGD